MFHNFELCPDQGYKVHLSFVLRGDFFNGFYTQPPSRSGPSRGWKLKIIWTQTFIWMFPKIVGFSPQIIHGLIGFSIIFTIHFGGFTPIFGVQHPWWTFHVNLPGLTIGWWFRNPKQPPERFWNPVKKIVVSPYVTGAGFPPSTAILSIY